MNKATILLNPKFCLTNRVNLTIAKSPIAIPNAKYMVTDDEGKYFFTVKQKAFTVRDRCVILDSDKNPVLTLKKKGMIAKSLWQAFKGDGSNTSDLVFTAKNSSHVKFKVELDVHLSVNPNVRAKSWDFKVVGNWPERSFVVYDKDSIPIAQMQKKPIIGSKVYGKDMISVNVNPQVDYVFIVSLVVILCQMNEDKD